MPSVAIVFRKPVFLTDSILALYAGKYVHVDICLVDEREPKYTMTCTSYVGHKFSMSTTDKRNYDDEDYLGLLIETTDTEQDKLTGYLLDLVENNIPYNYVDVAAMALPMVVADSLIDDVRSEDPAHITNLFCSQAVVLALRNCLSDSHPLLPLLAKVNSRRILPNTLCNILTPSCERISCSSLRGGLVSLYVEPCCMPISAYDESFK
jgi:hypothetical protein